MKALVIVGPTAVGKTGISLELAGNIFEIISADSVQVYRYLDIGSSKPDFKERKRVKHHLIDIVDPDFPFSAGDFCKEAKKACSEITKKSKMPLFVGGTGLYIDSFFKGLSSIPPIDESIRTSISKELENKELNDLYIELVKVDNEFAKSVHPNDKQRILRGLEVYRATGKPLSSFHKRKDGMGTDDTIYIGLKEERDLLRKRIDERVDLMLEAGFVDEVIYLRSKGYSPELNSLKSIGYHEINLFIDGILGYNDMVDKIKTNTKQYAKRQMTWFRKNDAITWFRAEEYKKIEEYIKKYFQ